MISSIDTHIRISEVGRSAAIEQALTDAIVTRTGGRIAKLALEVRGSHISIGGRAHRYYDKQLALQAVLDAIGDRHRIIELKIEVLESSSHSEQGSLASGRKERQTVTEPDRQLSILRNHMSEASATDLTVHSATKERMVPQVVVG